MHISRNKASALFGCGGKSRRENYFPLLLPQPLTQICIELWIWKYGFDYAISDKGADGYREVTVR